MSKYIVNAQIPQNCYECKFNIGEYEPAYYEKRYCALCYHDMRKIDYKRRPNICPLKEIDETYCDIYTKIKPSKGSE